LEIERTRLVEFIQILQQRLDQSHIKSLDNENKYLEQRKRYVHLEKDMEKLQSELNNMKNRTRNKQDEHLVVITCLHSACSS
jgi:hypothetical protein